MTEKIRVVVMMMLAMTLAVSCVDDVTEMDRKDRDNALVQRAMAKKKSGEVEAAVKLYKEALDSNPRLARAHLDLALLLHDPVYDYTGALYHYRRYLELRPDAEKKDMIEKRIWLAKQLMLTQAKQSLGGAERVGELEEENRRLRIRIQSLLIEIERIKSETGTAGNVSRSPVVVKNEMKTPCIYKVKERDTLQTIASRFYHDTERWVDILNGDKTKIENPNRLRVGQVLYIP